MRFDRTGFRSVQHLGDLMEFTVNNVMSLLENCRGKNYIKDQRNRKYKWAMLLPAETDEMQENILYVCPLSAALKRNHISPFFHFVCVCDRYLSDDDRDNEDFMQNIILIEEDYDTGRLLNIIQSRFLELNEWEAKLKDVLINKGSYQDILNVSENYLKNALFVLDDTYRLIAYSKNYKSTDPANLAIYETGYHSKEIMQKFYSKGLLPRYENSRGPILGDPGNVSEFENITQCCFINDNPVLQVVEVFYNTPRRADAAELFEILFNCINLLCISESNENATMRSGGSRLILSIIRGETTNIQTINSCAAAADIPIKGNFDVYKMVFTDPSRVLIGRFVQELSMTLPASHVVSEGHEVYVLNFYSDTALIAGSDRNLAQISDLISSHSAVCGVSSAFELFAELSEACEQAAKAAQTGLKLGGGNVYFYKDTFFHNLIEAACAGPDSLFSSNPYVKMLEKLEDHDRENGTELLRILRVYLENESRPTEAGRLLNMHRNTVMYNIQRISSMLDIDLGAFPVRQGLLIAYGYRDIR